MTVKASINKTISKRLLKARQDRGLTQSQLGAHVGFLQSHIAHFEAGRRVPTVSSLIALCRALEVTSDYVLGLTDHE